MNQPIPYLDLPAQFDEINQGATSKIGEDFTKYGLELVEFFINAISPPEEVQKAIDARSSMGAIGDLQAYTVYQAANSMRNVAVRNLSCVFIASVRSARNRDLSSAIAETLRAAPPRERDTARIAIR